MGARSTQHQLESGSQKPFSRRGCALQLWIHWQIVWAALRRLIIPFLPAQHSPEYLLPLDRQRLPALHSRQQARSQGCVRGRRWTPRLAAAAAAGTAGAPLASDNAHPCSSLLHRSFILDPQCGHPSLPPWVPASAHLRCWAAPPCWSAVPLCQWPRQWCGGERCGGG